MELLLIRSQTLPNVLSAVIMTVTEKSCTEECEGYGTDNLMFWTAWTTSSQAAGKKQENLSSEQEYILKYSPIAK